MIAVSNSSLFVKVYHILSVFSTQKYALKLETVVTKIRLQFISTLCRIE